MGILEYFLKIMIKIVVLIIVVTSGAFIVRILLHKMKELRKVCFILFVGFLIYLVAIAYLTIFSRNSSPDVAIELRMFRGVVYTIDLIYKFLKSCYYYLVESTWVGLQRPDINIPYIEEGALNILMFVPLGYLFPSITFYKRQYNIVHIGCVGFIFSFLIEIVQLLSNTGSFDLDDLLNNTLGALVGAWLFIKYIMSELSLYKRKDLEQRNTNDT